MKGFPCSLVGKESAYNAGDPGLIPGLRRSPGEDNRNAMVRGDWWATVHAVEESDATEQLN